MFQFLKKRLFKNSSSGSADVASLDDAVTADAVTEDTITANVPLDQVHDSTLTKSYAEPGSAANRSWRQRLRAGLARTSASLTTLFTGTRVDDALLEEIETALISADVGVQASQHLLLALRKQVKQQQAETPLAVKKILRQLLID